MSSAARPIFVSYAHHDTALAQRLVADLHLHLRSNTHSPSSLWIDRHILCGQDWDREIRAALNQSSLGILMLSPAFSCSDYIARVETPALVNKCLPVGLRLMDVDRQVCAAVRSRQIFRLQTSRSGPIFYSQCCTAQQREAFAFGLYQQIAQQIAHLQQPLQIQ